MTEVLVFVVLAVILFVSSFFAKRRFGLLGLALATGSLLSSIWAYDAGLLASGIGFPTSIQTSSVISVIITLLPAFVLLFHGYSYNNMIGRIVGSCLFTLLALSFLVEPLGGIVLTSSSGLKVYRWFIENKELIIGTGLIIAVVDLFLTKPVGSSKKHKAH